MTWARSLTWRSRRSGSTRPGSGLAGLTWPGCGPGRGCFSGRSPTGAPAGAAMIHDLRQWWLGRAVPCAGIASVKVAPELPGRRHRAAADDRAAGRGRGARLPAVGAVSRRRCRSTGRSAGSWPGGKYQATIPARSLRTLVAPDKHAASGARPHRGRRGRAEVRRAGPDDAAEIIAIIGRRPSGRPRRRRAHLGRRPDRAVAEPPRPVLVPGRRRGLRRATGGAATAARRAVRGAGARGHAGVAARPLVGDRLALLGRRAR